MQNTDQTVQNEAGKETEKVILVGVATGGEKTAEQSLNELADLARTAGAAVAGKMIQVRESAHPGTYIGKGKILELKELLWETEASGIICDDELTSAQLGNLEEELDCKVLDRTLLILDNICRPGCDRGRKTPGRTGTAEVPGVPPVRPGKNAVPSGGRNRHKRTRRKETGGGQEKNPGKDQQAETGTEGCGKAQRADPESEDPIRIKDSCPGRLYFRGKKQY